MTAATTTQMPVTDDATHAAPVARLPSANVQAGDAAGDHEALDLGGAFEDRVAAFDLSGAPVPPLPVRVRVPRVTLDPARFGAL
jgi:hypothetical protein